MSSTAYRVRVVKRHEDAACRRVRVMFLALYGRAAYRTRRRAIAQLPVVDWRGRVLHTIRCTGTTGKGPHDMNVPTSLLWNLIDFRCFRCVFHA